MQGGGEDGGEEQTVGGAWRVRFRLWIRQQEGRRQFAVHHQTSLRRQQRTPPHQGPVITRQGTVRKASVLRQAATLEPEQPPTPPSGRSLLPQPLRTILPQSPPKESKRKPRPPPPTPPTEAALKAMNAADTKARAEQVVRLTAKAAVSRKAAKAAEAAEDKAAEQATAAAEEAAAAEAAAAAAARRWAASEEVAPAALCPSVEKPRAGWKAAQVGPTATSVASSSAGHLLGRARRNSSNSRSQNSSGSCC